MSETRKSPDTYINTAAILYAINKNSERIKNGLKGIIEDILFGLIDFICPYTL